MNLSLAENKNIYIREIVPSHVLILDICLLHSMFSSASYIVLQVCQLTDSSP